MIWIDTDMGFDDMLATLLVAQSDIEIAGVSLVYGNAALPQICDNAVRAAAFFGWRFPFYAGADKALNGELLTAEHALGPKGMPTVGRDLPPAVHPTLQPVLPALCRWLEADDGPKDILALGPITNIALLASGRPDLIAKIRHLIWMGGGATSGNQTPAAEFNAIADPEALAVVLKSGVALRMVDLDVCRQVVVGPDDIAALGAGVTERHTLLHELYAGFVNIAISRNRAAMAIYDVVAGAAVVDPSTVSFVPARIDVDVSNTAERGRTIVQRVSHEATNAEIGDIADAVRIKEMALNALLRAS